MMHAHALLLRAERLLDDRQLPEALDAFHRAEQHGADPDRCSAGRWMANMLLGRFEPAWRESDAIRWRGAPDPHRLWNGESIDGKNVIVRCLHGFGDAVQFLRYLPLLRRKASRVIVEAAPQFIELARCFDGVEQLITWGEQAPARPPHWDIQIEVTELPYLFRTVVADLPLFTTYIDLPAKMLRSAASHFTTTNQLRIGVVWSSGAWNPARSIPFPALQPLLCDTRFEFWNLQGGTPREQWQLTTAPNLHDAPALCGDAGLLPLACFIAHLDLVITVDTLAAHLGGALGIPTWLMLRDDADWRWMTNRSDSPWYPSLRLFRQNADRNWNTVVEDLHASLAGYSATAAHRRAA